jgi:RNA 2',3'-cyclic 3'-phosphodiesterase
LKPHAAESTRRLFFALWPSAFEQHALAEAAHKAARRSGGRAVPEDKLHLTLAFLGSVAERRLHELSHIAGACAAQLAADGPLVVNFTRLEHWTRPQLLAAIATGGAEPARALAEALKNALCAAGFAPDLKPFRAHVTVARKVAHPPPQAMLRPIEWSLRAFALLDSRTEAAGPLYSVVESYALVKREKAQE